MAFVAKASEVPEGQIVRVEIGGRDIAVAQSDGEFYAFATECTHEGCDLIDEGEIVGNELTCVCHFSVFDLISGDVLDGPALRPLPVFEVTAGDELDVDV